MLQHLLESRARRQRRRGGTAASVVLHGLVVGAAVAATGRAAVRPAAEPEHLDLVFRPAAPARAPAPTPASSGEARRGGGSARLSEPTVQIPTVPGLDAPMVHVEVPTPGRAVDVAGEFVGHGLPNGLPNGPAVGSGAPLGDGPLAADVVDEPVVPDPRNPLPRYPEALRAAGVGGRVTARFVVDTLGRVEPGSVAFVAPGDPRLEASAREALARARFRPARAGGRRVRQLAERPFVFAPFGP